MTSTNTKPTHALPDQDQRDAILTELDRNILVEAAAGTGKTTSMVGRMTALIAEGKCQVGTLAAVTFTRKAAAELRDRFRIALEKATHSAEGEKRILLQDATMHIEACFIGTIHAFCGRLLRERPVEAGVDPAFEEIDDVADKQLRKEAWTVYARAVIGRKITGELAQFGLALGDLESSFVDFADYPDVEQWPTEDSGPLDMGCILNKLNDYASYMRNVFKKGPMPEDITSDTIIPKYRRLQRIIPYCNEAHPLQVMEILDEFKKPKAIHSAWPGKKEQALEEEAKWNDFRDEDCTPNLIRWRVKCYHIVIKILQDAQAVYDRMREESGVLNYQDLLMKAAALLKDSNARQYFRRRFTHLLVDEFQDTDPVQAEVMLFLTAENFHETDWSKCRPRPGALFVVGDPKQSIYRFRRADITTYNRTRQIIEASGGRVLRLSANFRAAGGLIQWTNRVFSEKFPERATEYAPAYVGLEPGKPDQQPEGAAQVHVLEIPKEFSKSNDDTLDYEADLIARSIRCALDGHSPLGHKRSPADFMIINWYTHHMSVYAEKLQKYGIPHQVTGGAALNEVEALKLLGLCFRAVIAPDDPVALVGLLRSELFGISDAALYAFKKAGGVFDYACVVPAEMDGAEYFVEIFEKLRTYAGYLEKLPPVVVLEKMVGDLGLAVFAGAREGGDVEAGGLAKAIEVLRNAQKETWSISGLAEHLDRMIEKEDSYDGISVLSGDRSAVRIMNLHKAKGLEAPVIFLAAPVGEKARDAKIHIDRSDKCVRGYMVMSKAVGDFSKKTFAHSDGWKSLEEKEAAFGAAERDRLMYVAATRAGSHLIITQRTKYKNRNPWKYFEPYLEDVTNLPDPGKVSESKRTGGGIAESSIQEAEQNIAERIAYLTSPTYATCAAREYAFDQTAVEPVSFISFADTGPKDENTHEEVAGGADWGAVIHQLLQLAAQNPDADLEVRATEALAARELDIALAGMAASVVHSVMHSKFWERAMASKKRFSEIPFQTLVEGVRPTVLRGVIDLVFEEDGKWVLVDYKTDKLPTGALAEKYAPQVRLYANQWQRLTKGEVKELGLYFSQTNEYVVLND